MDLIIFQFATEVNLVGCSGRVGILGFIFQIDLRSDIKACPTFLLFKENENQLIKLF